jgi:hypothetical protein
LLPDEQIIDEGSTRGQAHCTAPNNALCPPRRRAPLDRGEVLLPYDVCNSTAPLPSLPALNARFAKPAALPETAFVAVADKSALAETLCVQEERVVGRDNTVSFGGLKLQLPASPLRHHYVKARVRVHHYPDGALAVFHGPRCLARYDAAGAPIAANVSPSFGSRADEIAAAIGESCRRRGHHLAAEIDLFRTPTVHRSI